MENARKVKVGQILSDWLHPEKPRVAAPLKPMYKILGTDIAGVVDSVGKNVKQFKPSDKIWVNLSFPHSSGSFAKYVCVPENALRL